MIGSGSKAAQALKARYRKHLPRSKGTIDDYNEKAGENGHMLRQVRSPKLSRGRIIMSSFILCVKCKRMRTCMAGITSHPCRSATRDGTADRIKLLQKQMTNLVGQDRKEAEETLECLTHEEQERDEPTGSKHTVDTKTGYVEAKSKVSAKQVYCKACGRTARRPSSLRNITCKSLARFGETNWAEDRRIPWLAKNVDSCEAILEHYAEYGGDSLAVLRSAVRREQPTESDSPLPKRRRLWNKTCDQ